MKKLVLIIATFVLSFNLFAQEISKEEWKIMSRQERKEYSTVQLGSSAKIGWNGVGGITVEDKVHSYKLKEGNNPGSGAHLRIEISGASSGHVSMPIQISTDGTASATLSDNFGDRLTYRGRIVSLAESTVYKGQAVY